MSREPFGIPVCEPGVMERLPLPAPGLDVCGRLGWCLPGGCLVGLMCQGVFPCCEQVCSEPLFPAVPRLASMRLWSSVTMTRHATWAKVKLGLGPHSPGAGLPLHVLGSWPAVCALHKPGAEQGHGGQAGSGLGTGAARAEVAGWVSWASPGG